MNEFHEFHSAVVGQITHSSRNGGRENCEIKLACQLFPDVSSVSVFLDQPLDAGIAERQLRLIQDFVQLSDGLERIKDELFLHWDNCSDFAPGETDFEDKDTTFTAAEFLGLLVMHNEHWWDSNACQLRFKVPWDPEHGAGIFLRGGKVAEFGDI